MIRLSDLVVLEFFDTKSVDVNVFDNRLYLYSTTRNLTNRQLLFDDAYSKKQLTRKYSVSNDMDNVLLGTDNFYPEQGLGIADYHKNSELHKVTGQLILPLMELRTAKLFFGQGVLSDDKIIGHYLRIYVTLNDGSTVTLCSVIDFKSDTNVLSTPPRNYEGQLFNEALDIEFLDIDSLKNTNKDILKDLFGDNPIPETYYFEYVAFTNDSVDEFVENRYTFTKMSFDVINKQSLPINVSDEGLRLTLIDNSFYITSILNHETYDVSQYLNSLKENGEIYNITHDFNILEYDKDFDVIRSTTNSLVNLDNIYGSVNYRPIISNNCETFEVFVTVRIKNTTTGVNTSRTSSLFIRNINSKNYKALESISFEVKKETINNIVNRQVNKIYQKTDTPSIIHLEKRVYIQTQNVDELEILNANFTAKLNLSKEINDYGKLVLKIGDLSFDNLKDGEAIFQINEKAYLTKKEKFTITDEKNNAIVVGKLKYV